jgi:hypothetical protein
MLDVLEIMVLSSSFFACVRHLTLGISFLSRKTAEIVLSIPVRVNVNNFVTAARTLLLWIVVATSRFHSLTQGGPGSQ